MSCCSSQDTTQTQEKKSEQEQPQKEENIEQTSEKDPKDDASPNAETSIPTTAEGTTPLATTDGQHHDEESGFIGRRVFTSSLPASPAAGSDNEGDNNGDDEEVDATPTQSPDSKNDAKQTTTTGGSLSSSSKKKSETGGEDPYDLRRRFIRTHASDFKKALSEIQNGQKWSCWSWYIFPCAPWVVNGVERGSYTNMQYALRDLRPNQLRGDDAARAYLRFPTEHGVNLRQNYIDMMTEVTHQVKNKGISVRSLVGFLDDPKLRSSVRHFERISRDGFDDEVHKVCVACLKAMKENPDP